MEKYHLPYVVVFIPAYNEEDSIGRVIEMTKDQYKGPNQIQNDYVLDIIVIDDGSTDRTSEIAREHGLRVVHHPKNQGLGGATRTALRTCYEMGATVGVKIDADFQHDPEDIDKVVRPILEDRADSVFGTRFKGGLEYKMPLYRDWGNKFFSWLTGLITGLKVTDGQTGLMAFHRRYLKIANLTQSYNETQQLIIDSWGKHMRVTEVPVLFHKRTTGTSFISWKYPLIVLPNMIRLFIHFKPLRFFLPVGVLSIIAGLVIAILMTYNNGDPVGIFGNASVAIFILAGLQIMFFGMLADQIGKKRF